MLTLVILSWQSRVGSKRRTYLRYWLDSHGKRVYTVCPFVRGGGFGFRKYLQFIFQALLCFCSVLTSFSHLLSAPGMYLSFPITLNLTSAA
jgi:hypothetical protein